MKKIILTYCLLSISGTHAIFEYDRAVSCGKKGNWERAASLLNNVTADRPDVTYDKGVVAHHNKDLATAKDCFLQAACHSAADATLCERAHFNAGNACVGLNELEAACEQYKKVLALNPDNALAQHNLKKVEEMLKKKQEEQKQEEQEKKKDQDKKQQNKQQQKSDDNNKQEKNNESTDSGQQDKQQQGDSEQEPEQSGSEQESNKKQSEDKKSEQRQEQGADKEKKDNGAGTRADNQKGQQQTQGAQGQQKKDPASHDEWLAGMLAKSDKRDAQGSKKMIKAMVQQQMGGNEGQNCW
jgi:hypothetical protein